MSHQIAFDVGCDCERRPARLRFNLQADISSIQPVVDAVIALARAEMGDSGKDRDIGLALQEALANAVIHGSRLDANLSVLCWVAYDNELGMLIAVRDPGPGFDSMLLPDPTQAGQLYAEHGRGIHFIRGLMDEVHFVRGGSEIHMRKY